MKETITDFRKKMKSKGMKNISDLIPPAKKEEKPKEYIFREESPFAWQKKPADVRSWGTRYWKKILG